MAPSRSESQAELFPLLDGEQSVGVFYFPETSHSQADQIRCIDITILHLQTLRGVLEKHKISAAAAPKFSPVVKWLADFECHLQTEKEKLLALNQSPLHSTQDSTESARAETKV